MVRTLRSTSEHPNGRSMMSTNGDKTMATLSSVKNAHIWRTNRSFFAIIAIRNRVGVRSYKRDDTRGEHRDRRRVGRRRSTASVKASDPPRRDAIKSVASTSASHIALLVPMYSV